MAFIIKEEIMYCVKVVKGEKPMHGKLSIVTHKGKRLFYELPERFKVTRYHSLMVDKSDFPKDELSIDAIIITLSGQLLARHWNIK